MDALEFAMIRRRICAQYDYKCGFCPLGDFSGMSLECTLGVQNATPEDDKKTIAFVEAWGKEHPTKTRQSELLKLCPNVPFDTEGAVNICPKAADSTYQAECLAFFCHGCKMEYWGQEVE